MWTHGRDLEAVRFHLRLGFCGGFCGCSHTWQADNFAGCWTTAECKKGEQVICYRRGTRGGWANEHHHQPARGRKLVEHQVDCLGIGDMVDPDPAALDATVLKIGAGNKD